MERFEASIEKNINDPPDEFFRHQELGIQFLQAGSNSGDDAIKGQILKLMRYDVTKLLDGNGLNQITRH